MKTKNYADLTRAELQQALEEAHQELFNLRFQLSIGRLKNYGRIPQLRREIARIRTEQSRRRLLDVEMLGQEAEA
jgi:large subunit ribosomal protein L29